MKFDIIVAHPDQQHSYKLAAALKKTGNLYKYTTTVYYKKNSWTYLLSKFLRGNSKKKAENRQTSELSSEDIVLFCERRALFKLLCQNTSSLNVFYNKMRYNVADCFAKKVAKFAKKHRVQAVITYDDCSPLLFRYLKKYSPNIVRILDVSAASREYMKNVFIEDTHKAQEFATKLITETPNIWNDGLLERCKEEIRLADYYLVPSEFVSTSLIACGVSEERIFYCPYGVDVDTFKNKTYTNTFEHALRLIYVGGVTEYKGMYYLLEAISRFPKESVQLTVIGDASNHPETLDKYRKRVDFKGRVLHSEISKELKKHDVFIFPSLGDSFSFACLEAASSGLPLIVSENTGMKDFMTDGVEGFIVPIQSTDSIAEKIRWFLDNPEKICVMGANARKMAESVTWDKYDEKINNSIMEIINRQAR